MFNSKNHISIDKSGKEISPTRTPFFPISVNNGDIHQYIGSFIPSHWHTELEIFVLLSGSVQVNTGDAAYRLKQGDGCFINSGVIHSFTALEPGPCAYHSFVFDAGIVGGAPGSVFDTQYVRPLMENGIHSLMIPAVPATTAPGSPFHPSFQVPEAGIGSDLTDTDSRIYFEQFHLAFEACKSEHPGYEFQVRDALSKILLFIGQHSMKQTASQIPTIHEERLKQMLAFLDSHLSSNLTIKQIAASANISPRECQRVFSRFLHYHPMEILQRKRIFAAAQLLTTTNAPITEIALNCGFSSPSYFSKQFRAIAGCSPTEYRMEQ